MISVTATMQLLDRAQANIAVAHPDELHTVVYGIQSLYSGEVATLRVGETTRWFARALYPSGLYYMHSNLGGEHEVTGWGFPSNYIQRNLVGTQSLRSDPNLQDLLFALRVALGLLVIGSTLLAAVSIGNVYSQTAGVFYFSIFSSFPLIVQMRDFFYVDSVLVILINIVAAVAFSKSWNFWRCFFWQGGLFSLLASTKLTGLTMIVPIFVSLNSRLRGAQCHYRPELTLLFVILAAMGTFAINMFSVSYIEVLDQTLSNVYHYATGHGDTVPSGKVQIINAAKTLSPWGFVFLLCVPALVVGRYPNKALVLSFVFVILITTTALSGYHLFLSRNYIMNFLLITICISVFLNWCLERFDGQLAAVTCNIISLSIFVFYIASNPTPSTTRLLAAKIESCSSVGVIGGKPEWFDFSESIPSFPDAFNFKEIAESRSRALLAHDCIYVERSGNDKHYTNYLLLRQFEVTYRRGNIFLFQRRN